MTREEAIATLKANYPDVCFEQLRDAVDVAISALQQPEIIRCKSCSKWQTIDCPFFSKYITVIPNEEQYCSLAERRTDG